MTDISKKDQLYQLIRANPFISQQELADGLGLSRSAVAGHIAGLIRERRLLGRAYVLPDSRPLLCIGAANLDRKLRTLDKLQMGTSNPASAQETLGGVARNIAENLARLGLPVALLTVLGDDAAGQALQAHAEAAGIDTRGSLHLNGNASGTYTAVLDAHGEMLLALADMQLYEQLTPAFLLSRQPQRAAAALTVADLNLPRDSVALLIADARASATPLVIVAVSQPKMNRLPPDLHGVHLLILNRGELETRVGRALPAAADLQHACREVQAQGAVLVIVTCGGQGVYYTAPDGVRHLAARAVDIVDVTGAGDAFSAAVCWSLQRDGGNLRLACRRGMQLAALTLQARSTVSPLVSSEILENIVNETTEGNADAGLAPPPTLFQQD
ncbi:carbohydrate kinase [Janthinobacterium agaricidamnosum]|uniref:PfkB carbohydrate kinase family protein n=1 Tax=Janthinobacterium agaricidamnosum NBRC 102515 = DSM 9628 TaxID=1349767 RepID=W0V881_9BURK|nr:carbohydrate kinase [Janthinobacterium agaricidamnosum]CDG85024.1 pfkB carbohydrate kinase family protein [Janthinobacterium agaricidamnosum NBRC 102515 = DSM 9628]